MGMLGIVKEYTCTACGQYFESALPVCTTCGDDKPKRTFTGPPSFKSDHTKAKDTSIKEFVDHYSLGDFSNNQSTAHEKKTPHQWMAPTAVQNSPDINAAHPELNESRPDLVKGAMQAAKEKVLHPQFVSRDKTQTARPGA
jgi:hypothetical protein